MHSLRELRWISSIAKPASPYSQRPRILPEQPQMEFGLARIRKRLVKRVTGQPVCTAPQKHGTNGTNGPTTGTPRILMHMGHAHPSRPLHLLNPGNFSLCSALYSLPFTLYSQFSILFFPTLSLASCSSFFPCLFSPLPSTASTTATRIIYALDIIVTQRKSRHLRKGNKGKKST